MYGHLTRPLPFPKEGLGCARPEDQLLLGMQWQDDVYTDTFGLHLAPKIYTITDGSTWVLVKLTYYLDDFLLWEAVN